MTRWTGCFLLFGLLASCAHVSRRPPQTDSELLAQDAQEYWDFLMAQSPVWATFLGERQYDAELPDWSAQAFEARAQQLERFATRAKELNEGQLTPEERITRAMIIEDATARLKERVCKSETWNINALDGIQVMVGELPQLHSVEKPEQAKSLEIRYLKYGALMDQHLANLRRGVAENRLAAKPGVERVLAQLDRILAEKPEASALVTTVTLPAAWRDEEKQQTRSRLLEAVRTSVYPALTRYREFLHTQYLAAARVAPGVNNNTDGTACYQARIRLATGLSLSPQQIHDIGVKEIESLEVQMRAIAQNVVKTPDVAKLEAHLEKDPSQRVKTAGELLAVNQRLVAKALAAMPQAFGKLPARPVEVKPIEAFREKDAPAGYYYEGAGDRPGYYYLNTSDAPKRLLYQAESLAFHEAIPGHHLQIALAQELTQLPKFRQHEGASAFVEGWAHYAELLADELSLYSSPAARYGMLSDQALRAARLVLDTGLHALGWSREQAIQYMEAHTAEPHDEVVREVDRYIVWPGQALAYKLGQREILALRAEAKEKLGPAFDIRAFHDELLAHGAVPLPVLRELMAVWMEKQKPRAEAVSH